MAPSQSARVLLEGIIDYAGTFPPAGLALADAVSTFARDRASADAWMLGRLIVPATALRQFEQLAANLPNLSNPPNRTLANPANPSNPSNVWPLSIVLGPQRGSLEEALVYIEAQHQRSHVLSVEFSPMRPDEIRAMKDQLPPAVEMFFETPLDTEFDRRIDAIADARGMAKVRTGGLMAGAIPGPEGLVRFFTSCDDAGIACKATAGLHHAVRGSYALTYEAGSPTATMHGFLNVCVAAALVREGADPSEAADALAESSDNAFRFGDSGLVWRDRMITNEDLAAMRQQFLRSFGSCAFREPVEELKKLGLL